MLQTTLCYIEENDKYLMLHRTSKDNDINKDKWIGVGGKFEPGEAPEECMLREVREETGLNLTSWRFRGILTFCSNLCEPEYIFLYTADKYTGELSSCSEGTHQWVSKKDIYNLNLWDGDKIMFQLLEERTSPFSLKLIYDGDTLINSIEF